MLRHNIFWYAAQLGILNYDRDFWRVCEEAGVEVLEEDPAPHQDYENHDVDPQGLLRFQSGRTVRTDAIVPGTGRKLSPSSTFKPIQDLDDMGVSSSSCTTA